MASLPAEEKKSRLSKGECDEKNFFFHQKFTESVAEKRSGSSSSPASCFAALIESQVQLRPHTLNRLNVFDRRLSTCRTPLNLTFMARVLSALHRSLTPEVFSFTSVHTTPKGIKGRWILFAFIMTNRPCWTIANTIQTHARGHRAQLSKGFSCLSTYKV